MSRTLVGMHFLLIQNDEILTLGPSQDQIEEGRYLCQFYDNSENPNVLYSKVLDTDHIQGFTLFSSTEERDSFFQSFIQMRFQRQLAANSETQGGNTPEPEGTEDVGEATPITGIEGTDDIAHVAVLGGEDLDPPPTAA